MLGRLINKYYLEQGLERCMSLDAGSTGQSLPLFKIVTFCPLHSFYVCFDFVKYAKNNLS